MRLSEMRESYLTLMHNITNGQGAFQVWIFHIGSRGSIKFNKHHSPESHYKCSVDSTIRFYEYEKHETLRALMSMLPDFFF